VVPRSVPASNRPKSLPRAAIGGRRTIRSPRRNGRAPGCGAHSQPGLSQSFFISREVFGPPVRAQHVFKRKHVGRDSVASAEPLPYVPAPAVRPLRCLRRRYVIQVERPDCPAMPSSPTMLLRRSGPGKKVHARSRLALLSPADQGAQAHCTRKALDRRKPSPNTNQYRIVEPERLMSSHPSSARG